MHLILNAFHSADLRKRTNITERTDSRKHAAFSWWQLHCTVAAGSQRPLPASLQAGLPSVSWQHCRYDRQWSVNLSINLLSKNSIHQTLFVINQWNTQRRKTCRDVELFWQSITKVTWRPWIGLGTFCRSPYRRKINVSTSSVTSIYTFQTRLDCVDKSKKSSPNSHHLFHDRLPAQQRKRKSG